MNVLAGSPVSDPDERLVAALPNREERAFDASLRPRSLSEYIGQPALRAKLDIYLEAARRRADVRLHG